MTSPSSPRDKLLEALAKLTADCSLAERYEAWRVIREIGNTPNRNAHLVAIARAARAALAAEGKGDEKL